MKITFCGHGDICYNSDFKQHLYEILEGFIKGGADEFLLGGYGNFDITAALVVKDLKEKYPHIRSVLVVPYRSMKCNHNLYDYSIYPDLDGASPRAAIPKRNNYMVDNADIVIAYICRVSGGAIKTYRYAKEKHKTIINLAEI